MEKVAIQTTQNVVIDYEIASVGDRILATLLDYLFFAAYYIALVFIGLASSGFGGGGVILIILLILPVLLYDLLCETFMNGQSFGKKIMKIKVVTLNGTQPTFGKYLIRWIFRLADMKLFSGIVALITVLINGKGQRLGDIAAGTTVIKIKTRVTLRDTILHKPVSTYKVVFPEVVKLSDTDVGIIKDILRMVRRTNNREALEKLAIRTKEVMEVKSEMPDAQFLETVLKDYNQYKFEE